MLRGNMTGTNYGTTGTNIGGTTGLTPGAI
jgi:hypothetical protein